MRRAAMLPLTAGALLLLALPARAQPAAPAQGCVQRDLEITRSTTLDPACRYLGTVTITGSDLVLDCRGATLDGEYKVQRTLRIGWTRRVTGVEVRNCVVTGSRSHGVIVGLGQPDGRKPTDAEGHAFYDQHPQNILLRNLTVRRNSRVGVYIDDYVRKVTLRDSTIEENGGAGVYLEHSSRGSQILGNRILRNGRGATGGVPRADRGWREGIAVDSSAENVITGNVISGNAAGGIFLYRNCGERPGNPDQVTRWQPASRNLIRDNQIQGGVVGIWLASRQDRPFEESQCRLRPDPARHIFADAAPDNRVEANRISGVRTGIRVADDGNSVSDNTIQASQDCLLLGSEDRNRRGVPVGGLTVRDNACRGGAVSLLPQTGLAPGSALPRTAR